MSNLWKRVILTNITVPTVFFTLFFPLKTHILLIILFGVVVTYLGSYEINALIYNKGINVNKHFIPVVNTYIYLGGYIFANNLFHVHEFKAAPYLFVLGILLIISFVYARDILLQHLDHAFEKNAYTLFGILYIGIPSFLMPFLLNIDITPVDNIPGLIYVKPYGTYFGAFLVIYLIICIWVNDIFAYVFGVTLGKNNKLGLAVSPNKSLAGYVGGYLMTFVFVGVYYLIFQKQLNKLPALFYFICPIFTGFLVPIGDLVESVFKRSANVKDSGNIILGRGGVLDSVDTLLYVIPLFFISLQVYFAFIS